MIRRSFHATLLLLLSAAPLWADAPVPWPDLERYQFSITRAEFEHLLNRFYNPSRAIYKFIEIDDARAILYHGASSSQPDFILNFAPDAPHARTPAYLYKTVPQLARLKNSADKPLRGIRVALDPGHIGGPWADMEERQVSWAGLPTIREGECNLLISGKIKPRLEALGATVMLTHTAAEPVTASRPGDWMNEAAAAIAKKHGIGVSEALRSRQSEVAHLAEMYFYRKAEIHERGERLRRFRPDLCLSIHLNATELSGAKRLTKANRHAFFINAAYTSEEVENELTRYYLFSKLLERSLPMECAVGDALTEEVLKVAPLKPNSYGWTKTTCPVNDNPYLNGRNLAATRQFPGPTVLCELFYMNNAWTAERLSAGDYAGARPIAGGVYRSIYEDYAEIVTQGVSRLYARWTVDGKTDYPPTTVTEASYLAMSTNATVAVPAPARAQ
ncbi:MAG: N-acetylmuramoyl-L-alanine amidase [Verrucomicrobiae bacterium]|nr:N-acetylmuramoyl-L-alanine amidase [Verrucomicrobiae bacterium]